ncbi:hypothetical protein B5D80_01325 [Micromonospora wenchangensis]|uniref:HTH cro/C1-type domain-containing protein n=1 Tax=Micromonospora wenchangensis TaxID=1185415 RepID=A0A246RT32_9ACTN|nr:DUF2690 domain-containing protein [Micromonospora wenchangensis]OWV12832.1 hypothetical protein B5D80_01325 [Micromonospora wenchangensis]
MTGRSGRVGEQVSGEARHHQFVADLARLRRAAGQPSLRRMSATAHYSHTALAGVLSGTRLPSLELTLAFVRACGGDEAAWRDRWHREAALDQPAAPAPDGSAGEPPGRSTPEVPQSPPRRTPVPRWALVAAAGVTVLVVGSVVPMLADREPRTDRPAERAVDASGPAPTDAAAGAGTPVPDGADPQEERCQVDAVSAETVPVPDPDPTRPTYGNLTLRYSPRCRAAWPLFVSTERVPTGATIRLAATRPVDGAASRFDYPFMIKSQVYSVFGNVLRTTRGCVSVTVDITAADNRSVLASARTPCVQLGART